MGFGATDVIKCTTLAYVGDAVFTLRVRARYGGDPTIGTKALMDKCCRLVSAVVQARIHDDIMGDLNADELALMTRCRNAHVTNKAKNATMAEYKKATALEGLLGALYLAGEEARLNEILDKCLVLGESYEQSR